MKKHQEALKRIMWLFKKLADWNGYDLSDLDDEYNYMEDEKALQELVDKATPMKVLNREQHSKDSDAYGDCPICKTPLCDYTNPKGCGGCLQAIDWSEEE